MPTITLSFDTHKHLNVLRNSETESFEAAIRRLLQLPSFASTETGAAEPTKDVGRPWIAEDGTAIPHGTELQHVYKGTPYSATVEDGKLIYNGEQFDSLSNAAHRVTAANGGSAVNKPNGWLFWKVLIPETNKWQPVDCLRK